LPAAVGDVYLFWDMIPHS